MVPTLFPIVICLMLMSFSLAEKMCLGGCECSDETSDKFGNHLLISCSNLGITGVPKDISKFQNYEHPIHFVLSKNMITRVSKADFPPNIPFIAFDFSQNRGVMITDDAFDNTQGIKSLKLNDVSLRFTDKMNYLNGMKSLRYLSLNKNFQFGAGLIPVALLSGLGLGKLVNVQFHDCYLKGIEDGAFADVTLSGNLDLGANQLDNIPDELRTLSNITSLDLSQNSIKSIPGESFRGMTNLRTLSISNNYISQTSIEKDAFSGLNLRELLLEQSVLNTIPTEALAPLSNLKVLKLKNSPIKSIPIHSFDGSFCLEYLDLTNALVEIEEVHLDGLEHCLNKLYLSNMQIRNVPDFLKKFNVLEYLSLSGNSISVIEKDDFVGTSITELSLSQNPLSEIQSEAFQPFPHGISIDLSGTHMSNLSFVRDYAYGTIKDLTLGNISPPCDCDLAFAEYRVLAIHGNCDLNNTRSISISTEEFMELTSHCWPAGRTPFKKDVWSTVDDSGSPLTIANSFIVLLSLFSLLM